MNGDLDTGILAVDTCIEPEETIVARLSVSRNDVCRLGGCTGVEASDVADCCIVTALVKDNAWSKVPGRCLGYIEYVLERKIDLPSIAIDVAKRNNSPPLDGDKVCFTSEMRLARYRERTILTKVREGVGDVSGASRVDHPAHSGVRHGVEGNIDGIARRRRSYIRKLDDTNGLHGLHRCNLNNRRGFLPLAFPPPRRTPTIRPMILRGVVRPATRRALPLGKGGGGRNTCKGSALRLAERLLLDDLRDHVGRLERGEGGGSDDGGADARVGDREGTEDGERRKLVADGNASAGDHGPRLQNLRNLRTERLGVDHLHVEHLLKGNEGPHCTRLSEVVGNRLPDFGSQGTRPHVVLVIFAEVDLHQPQRLAVLLVPCGLQISVRSRTG